MRIYNIKYFWFTLSCLSLFISNNSLAQNQQEITVKAGLYKGTYLGFQHHFEGDICSNLLKVKHIEIIDRSVVDIIILCSAFANQQTKLNIQLVLYPNNRRARTMVASGDIDILLTAIWKADIDNKSVLQSKNVVLKNEFEKGIYVYEHHPLLNVASENINLDEYTGITIQSWQYDWKILGELTNNRTNIGHIPALYKMLKRRRADFTLLEFSSLSEMASFDHSGIKLLPVKGVKVLLNDVRRFIVSKKFKHAEHYIHILDKGIQKMHSEGTIKTLYKKAGFFNENTTNWRLLN